VTEDTLGGTTDPEIPPLSPAPQAIPIAPEWFQNWLQWPWNPMVGMEARSINIGISAQERAKLASIKQADGVPKAMDMVRHLVHVVHQKTAGMLRRILEE
jgi:hypothetical protein